MTTVVDVNKIPGWEFGFYVAEAFAALVGAVY